MSDLTLRIDRLILDGIDLPRREESRFRAAVERELVLLFTERARPAQTSPAIASLDGGVIHGAAQVADASLARQIARRVYASLEARS